MGRTLPAACDLGDSSLGGQDDRGARSSLLDPHEITPPAVAASATRLTLKSVFSHLVRRPTARICCKSAATGASDRQGSEGARQDEDRSASRRVHCRIAWLLAIFSLRL